MKILIVDDSSVARRIIALAVEALGYGVVEATSGEEGLAALDQAADEIALVLLDWNMPGLTGIEVLRKIKADPRTRDIPVMMVTTEMERSNMVEAVRAGAKHYVTKPLTAEDLSVRILQCLGVAK